MVENPLSRRLCDAFRAVPECGPGVVWRRDRRPGPRGVEPQAASTFFGESDAQQFAAHVVAQFTAQFTGTRANFSGLAEGDTNGERKHHGFSELR